MGAKLSRGGEGRPGLERLERAVRGGEGAVSLRHPLAQRKAVRAAERRQHRKPLEPPRNRVGVARGAPEWGEMRRRGRQGRAHASSHLCRPRLERLLERASAQPDAVHPRKLLPLDVLADESRDLRRHVRRRLAGAAVAEDEAAPRGAVGARALGLHLQRQRGEEGVAAAHCVANGAPDGKDLLVQQLAQCRESVDSLPLPPAGRILGGVGALVHRRRVLAALRRHVRAPRRVGVVRGAACGQEPGCRVREAVVRVVGDEDGELRVVAQPLALRTHEVSHRGDADAVLLRRVAAALAVGRHRVEGAEEVLVLPGGARVRHRQDCARTDRRLLLRVHPEDVRGVTPISHRRHHDVDDEAVIPGRLHALHDGKDGLRDALQPVDVRGQ
mmetsp:Transcript_9658/g.30686  ORF Transcript_9658/g.30686 Transcript_9658/m.30686 type:complete len:386 (+) Transcript_9658:112-1269(+)